MIANSSHVKCALGMEYSAQMLKSGPVIWGVSDTVPCYTSRTIATRRAEPSIEWYELAARDAVIGAR